MKASLKDLGFDVKCFHDLNNHELSQCIYNFGQELDNYDVGLFFYAGHGVEVNGANYLIPIDATTKSTASIAANSVNILLLMNWLSSYQNKTNIVILDACRTLLPIGDYRGINVAGLSNIFAPRGTLISYSTSPNSAAFDGTGSNGLFTEVLLHHVQIPGLKIEDVFKNVRIDVEKKSAGSQIPWEHSSLVGDFYFIEPRHIFSKTGISPQDIYNYIEEEKKRNSIKLFDNRDEAEVFISASNQFNIPLIEIFRGYYITKNNSYHNFSDAQLDVLAIVRFVSLGFVEENYRWYFDGAPVRMGEILPLPPDMERMLPDKGRAIDVSIDIFGEQPDDKFIVSGICNLPNSLKLMISVKNRDYEYWAQDSVIVTNGIFISQGFTNTGKKLSPGEYLIEISSPIYSVQPEETKDILGSRCRNLIGKNVEYSTIGGNMIKYAKPLVVS